MATVRALDAVTLDGESAEQALHRFLSARRLLLVVDNCEHLPGVAAFAGGVLEACPGVSVLATSREPLDLRAEARHPVPPLSVHDDAVELFAERARAQDPELAPDDAAITEICARLDGLPLAIELAAARCSLLAPAEIAQRLDSALGALGTGARDAPDRQRTLRATIDWSYDLLDERERTAFSRFAVFAGGATVDAVEAITGADLDTVDRLVAKSLLARRHGDRTRLSMLETIREYAGERFAASPDAEAVHERYFAHFLAFAERVGSEPALCGAEGKAHLGALDAEIENLHAALGWAVAGARAERALAMCAALARYWRMRHRHADAIRWIDAALALPAPPTIPPCGPTRSPRSPGPCSRSAAVRSRQVSRARRSASPAASTTRRCSRRSCCCAPPARSTRSGSRRPAGSRTRHGMHRAGWATNGGWRWRPTPGRWPRARRPSCGSWWSVPRICSCAPATSSTPRTCTRPPPTPRSASAATPMPPSTSPARRRPCASSKTAASG